VTAIETQGLARIGRPVSGSAGVPDDSRLQAAGYVSGIADGNLATPVKLRDFLFGVGIVYRLPKKEQKKPKATAKPTRFAIRIPARQIALALSPIAVALIAYTGYQQLSGEPMPLGVQGLWATEDGRYKGRSFWLNDKNVAFQNGALSSQFTIHAVKRVTSRRQADTLFLNVDYESDGKRVNLPLAYFDRPAPEVRLVNQPSIRWTKTGNAPTVR
jgi:hypothetical protein